MIPKRDDLIKLIRSGDTSDLNYVLDSFGLVKKGAIFYGDSQRNLLNAVFVLVSAHMHSKPLKEDFITELIAHTAACCEMYMLIDLIRVAIPDKIKESIGRYIPECISAAISEQGYYCDDVAADILDLDEADFFAMIAYLDAGCELGYELRVGYNAPIIRQLHKYHVIGDDLLFSYMALCLR